VRQYWPGSAIFRCGEVADLPAIQRVDEAVLGEGLAYPYFVL
jgi:hypothetical protein